MILESRSIIFSDEELFIALRPIIEGRGMSADISVDAVVTGLDDEGEVAVTLEIKDAEPIKFSSRELGAAVLNHCIDQGIPLPRGSYKELATRGDHVALIVRMESGVATTDIDLEDE